MQEGAGQAEPDFSTPAPTAKPVPSKPAPSKPAPSMDDDEMFS